MKRFAEHWERRLSRLAMRYSDGGAQSSAEGTEPANAGTESTGGTDAGAGAAQPASKTDPEAKTYTEAELEAARQQAVEAYKQHLEEAKDYEKMTPEEKVAYLEKQREEDRIARYATEKLSAQNLPVELLPFVQGPDEAGTDERLKTFKAAYDKAVQAGVEARFKLNGYIPRGSAASASERSEQKQARPRGVSMK